MASKRERLASLASVLGGNAIMVVGIVCWGWDVAFLALLAVLELLLLLSTWATRMLVGLRRAGVPWVLFILTLLGAVSLWPLWFPSPIRDKAVAPIVTGFFADGGWRLSLAPIVAVTVPAARSWIQLWRHRAAWRAHALYLVHSQIYYNLCLALDWLWGRYAVSFYAVLAAAMSYGAQTGHIETLLVQLFVGLYVVAKVVVDVMCTLHQDKQVEIFAKARPYPSRRLRRG